MGAQPLTAGTGDVVPVPVAPVPRVVHVLYLEHSARWRSKMAAGPGEERHAKGSRMNYPVMKDPYCHEGFMGEA